MILLLADFIFTLVPKIPIQIVPQFPDTTIFYSTTLCKWCTPYFYVIRRVEIACGIFSN